MEEYLLYLLYAYKLLFQPEVAGRQEEQQEDLVVVPERNLMVFDHIGFDGICNCHISFC